MGYRVHIDDLIVVLRQNGRMVAIWQNGRMAEWQEWRNGIWNGGMTDGRYYRKIFFSNIAIFLLIFAS